VEQSIWYSRVFGGPACLCVYARRQVDFGGGRGFISHKARCFIGLLILAHPAYRIALIILLQSAVPPITGASIHAEREGGSASITNQFILASFAVSVVSIPLMFTLFSRFFPIP
jgi:hypothetical protein